MLLALGVAIVTETWPSEERGKALGFSAGVISLGIVVGPTAGGLIIAALSWHWIFFVNVPLGVLALLAVWRYVPPLRPKSTEERFDFLGAAVFGIGLLALLLGLTVGQTTGFTKPGILALFAGAAIALVGFVLIERRVRYPMVDLNLFRNLQFSLNLTTGALTFVAIAAVVFLLSCRSITGSISRCRRTTPLTMPEKKSWSASWNVASSALSPKRRETNSAMTALRSVCAMSIW